ncbi:hypothetical protein NG2371_06839 [Nocardia gamkensis]|nr:hypothetical protein [Nocardia gamkensis]
MTPTALVPMAPKAATPTRVPPAAVKPEPPLPTIATAGVASRMSAGSTNATLHSSTIATSMRWACSPSGRPPVGVSESTWPAVVNAIM